MKPTFLLIIAAFAFFHFEFIPTRSFAATPRLDRIDHPNIILMMVDDMGYAGLSCYGNPHFQTPHLDQLASDGLMMTDFHSSGTVCSPTRAGLLTGRYQQRSGIEAVIHPVSDHPEHLKGLHPSEITIAEILKNHGYRTGLVGKWHLGYAEENPIYHPLNHGFDEFTGYLSGNIDFISHWGDHLQHDWWHGNVQVHEPGYVTHLINQYALEFIDRNHQEPFFLYIPHLGIHAPFQGPDDEIQRGPDGDHLKRSQISIKTIQQMTIAIDEGVQAIRQRLQKYNINQQTLFIFISDNGGQSQTQSNSTELRGTKGTVYEGGHRIPAIFCWPGHIPRGVTSKETSISIDLMPTIVSLTESEKYVEKMFDGVDLSNHLLHGEKLEPRKLYWASLSNQGRRSEAIRSDQWKLVVQHPGAKPGTYQNPKVSLYDLSTDLEESLDVQDHYPNQTRELMIELQRWLEQVNVNATPQPGGWLKD